MASRAIPKSHQSSPINGLIIASIRFYQVAISPAFPNRCRFYPSCSSYALEAVQRHGAMRGLGMAVRRLLRCHPFHPAGYDPVP